MLAPNPLYRAIHCEWTNNEASGSELVQLLVRLSGSSWLPISIFAVSGLDQTAAWDTALPLAEYDLAMRFLNGATPAVGYESDDPDDWTAATAADSKSTITTSCEPVAWVSAVYSGGIETLTWTSAQQGVPYLLELSTDGGVTYTTLAANLVATSYAYPVPTGQLNTTVRFRLTAQRDLIVGPTAGTIDAFLGIAVGIPTLVAARAYSTVVGINTQWTYTAYVSWLKGTATAAAAFIQLQYRDHVGPGPWIAGPVAAFAAPDVGSVPVQPDGFVPVGIATFTTAADRDSSALDVQVALGVTDGSGITFGPWVNAPRAMNRSNSSATQPVPTFGTLTATDAPVTITVPNDSGALSFPTLMFFDTDVSKAAAWGMGLVVGQGVQSQTLKIPPAWVGTPLFEANVWSESEATPFPLFFANGIVTPTRNLMGTIP